MIVDGMELEPANLPVPTSKIGQSLCAKTQKLEFGMEWRGDNEVIIRKYTYSDEHEREVRLKKYDFKDYVCRKGAIFYRENREERAYVQLSGLSAYWFIKNGMFFIKDAMLCFLSEDRVILQLGKADAGLGVINFAVGKDGLEMSFLEGYKEVLSNGRAEESMGDYVCLIDRYQIKIKKKIFYFHTLSQLIDRKRKWYMRQKEHEREMEQAARKEKRFESSSWDNVLEEEEEAYDWDALKDWANLHL